MAEANNNRAQGTHLTPKEKKRAQEAFLQAFSVMGNVRSACTMAEISRETVRRWLKTDKTFKRRYEEDAEPDAIDFLEEEALRRAVQGVEKPVVSRGEVVYADEERTQILMVREYSDPLLMFLLRARNPQKYRERPPQIDVTQNTVNVGAVKEQLLEKLRALPAPVVTGISEVPASEVQDDG